MMQKKTSFTELFYLTLLITALRPPDNTLYHRQERAWYGSTDTLGPILAEDICFNAGDRYLNSGSFYNDYVSSKSPVLLDETHQVLQYINSLGRYSQATPFSSNLFAYPVSRGLSNEAENNVASISSNADVSFLSSSTETLIEPPVNDLFSDFEVRLFIYYIKIVNSVF